MILLDSEIPYKCEVCGARATKQCARCRVTYYCCREHQKEAHRVHKKECDLEAAIARVLTQESRSPRPKPASARCLYCLEDDDKLVHLGCACRGDAGWAHVKCAFEGPAADWDDLYECSVCRQEVSGAFKMSITAAIWRAHRRAPGGMLGLTEECGDLRGALDRLIACFYHFGEHETALRVALPLHDVVRGMHPMHHPQCVVSVSRVSALLSELGRHREANRLREPFLDLWRTTTAEDPECEYKLFMLESYAIDLMLMGEYDQAEPLLRQCLEASRTHTGDDSDVTISNLSKLAKCLMGQRRSLEARETASLALDKARRVLGPDHWRTQDIIGLFKEWDE